MEDRDKNKVYIRKVKPSFTSEQRAGFILVIVFSVLSIILGFGYVLQHLSIPFNIEYTGPMYLTPEDRQAQEIFQQKNSDTDNDGLTDYDEIYSYGTNPYLKDSDGDGYDDKTEITSGSDPNCVAGADCSVNVNDISVANEGIIDVGNGEEQVSDVTYDASQVEAIITAMSVDDIRVLLVKSGADQEQVDALSDEDVQILFDSVIADLKASGDLDSLITNSLQ